VNAPAGARAPGFGDLLARIASEAKLLASDVALLAVLDARRAAIRLAWLLGTVLVTAVLAVTAWMGLVAVGIVVALGQGASWVLALSVAALLNIGAAVALGFWMRDLVQELPFKALVRALRGEPAQKP
jgi:fatty acid desaturase